jgi:hypothetical protein
MTAMTPPSQVPEWPLFVLVGSHGPWAADCLVPGCLRTVTTSTAEAADRLAIEHTSWDHVLEGIGS